MKLAPFIAQKLNNGKQSEKRISLPIVNIAKFGIILGTSVMLLAIFVVEGYRKEIYWKVTGFGAPIELVNYDTNNSYQAAPIATDSLSKIVAQIPAISHTQPYGLLPGVLKTDEETEAVVFKGVDKTYDWSFLQKHLAAGRLPNLDSTATSNEVLVSSHIADRLNYQIGDQIYAHFLQDPPRMRRLDIVGIYQTRIIQFDQLFVLADLRHIQKLNNWTENQSSGIELKLAEFGKLEETYRQVLTLTQNRFDQKGTAVRAVNIKDKFSEIFSWLEMINMNVRIILILVIIVSSFNMISALLVLILEKTRTIGVLKSLGMNNWQVQQVFLYQSAYIVLRGMLWGNLLGIGIALLQQHGQFLKLDANMYFLDTVPIEINWWYVLLLNVSVLALTVCVMLLPAILITKIVPAKVIRFD